MGRTIALRSAAPPGPIPAPAPPAPPTPRAWDGRSPPAPPPLRAGYRLGARSPPSPSGGALSDRPASHGGSPRADPGQRPPLRHAAPPRPHPAPLPGGAAG